MFSVTSMYAQDKTEKPKEQKGQHEMEGTSVKELDAFHELLHPLVHDAYPKKDFETIKKGVPDLITSATVLTGVSLPKELSAKKSTFKKDAKKLVKQLKDLDKKGKALSDKEYGKKFMEMHDTFEKLMDMTR